jgi:hypothetical protein
MRGTYRPRKPKSTLSLRDIRCAVHEAECAAEDAGILLGRAHVALERDALALRERALALMVATIGKLADAAASLDDKLAARCTSKSARQDARRLQALSQTEPTGDRSEASSSKTAGASLAAPAVASHGGGA